MLHEKLAKLMKKKGESSLSDNEKNAKMGVLHDLKNMASHAMSSKLDGLKKVSVASDSDEGLAQGLEHAKAIIHGDTDTAGGGTKYNNTSGEGEDDWKSANPDGEQAFARGGKVKEDFNSGEDSELDKATDHVDEEEGYHAQPSGYHPEAMKESGHDGEHDDASEEPDGLMPEESEEHLNAKLADYQKKLAALKAKKR